MTNNNTIPTPIINASVVNTTETKSEKKPKLYNPIAPDSFNNVPNAITLEDFNKIIDGLRNHRVIGPMITESGVNKVTALFDVALDPKKVSMITSGSIKQLVSCVLLGKSVGVLDSNELVFHLAVITELEIYYFRRPPIIMLSAVLG